jgi:hypothetical protein
MLARLQGQVHERVMSRRPRADYDSIDIGMAREVLWVVEGQRRTIVLSRLPGCLQASGGHRHQIDLRQCLDGG